MRKDREKPSASRLTVDLAMTWKRPLCYLTGFEPAFHQAMVLFQLSNIRCNMRARISTSHNRTLNPLFIGISGLTV